MIIFLALSVNTLPKALLQITGSVKQQNSLSLQLILVVFKIYGEVRLQEFLISQAKKGEKSSLL